MCRCFQTFSCQCNILLNICTVIPAFCFYSLSQCPSKAVPRRNRGIHEMFLFQHTGPSWDKYAWNHKPQQVPLDSTMSFGASAWVYILREKPKTQGSAAPGEDKELKCLLGLPKEEMELNVCRLILCLPQLVLSRVF